MPGHQRCQICSHFCRSHTDLLPETFFVWRRDPRGPIEGLSRDPILTALEGCCCIWHFCQQPSSSILANIVSGIITSSQTQSMCFQVGGLRIWKLLLPLYSHMTSPFLNFHLHELQHLSIQLLMGLCLYLT